MRRVREIMSAAPVCMAPGESVSVGDLALEKDAASVLSGVSSAPPDS